MDTDLHQHIVDTTEGKLGTQKTGLEPDNQRRIPVQLATRHQILDIPLDETRQNPRGILLLVHDVTENIKQRHISTLSRLRCSLHCPSEETSHCVYTTCLEVQLL
ncbi:hypothetical protein PAMA_011170 [Pampus argenteus]